ncbi:nucleoside monophosphate kinase [Candidatus Saccharibacteria bacterium]|nr:nucleoside monophosphate kinase [Candidatus Saccharibacteria bacterium]
MIILFGMAGSGKGTQGKALSEIFGWRWIATGQMIRENGGYNEIIDKGNIIPDAAMIEMLEKALAVTDAEGYDVILDGFPRNAAQAEWLIRESGHKVDGGIVLEVPKEELYNRLYMRAGLDGRVDDQEKSVIERRFEVFEEHIGGILEVFKKHGIPTAYVNGVGEEGVVTDRLVDKVQKMCPAAREQNDDVNGGEIEKSYGE